MMELLLVEMPNIQVSSLKEEEETFSSWKMESKEKCKQLLLKSEDTLALF